jgi:hypothetical protein
MPYEAQAVMQASKLAISSILLMILAAILFDSLSLMMPSHHATVWRVPALIGAGGAVALMIAWPFRSDMRAWVTDGLAAVLGFTSAVPGIGVVLLITYGLILHVSENQGTTESLMFQLSEPSLLRELLRFAIIPAATGAIGLSIARRRARVTGRASFVAMAARFSLLGLSLSALVGLVTTVAAICRWVMWPG